MVLLKCYKVENGLWIMMQCDTRSGTSSVSHSFYPETLPLPLSYSGICVSRLMLGLYRKTVSLMTIECPLYSVWILGKERICCRLSMQSLLVPAVKACVVWFVTSVRHCLNTFGKAVLHRGGGGEQVERVIERFGREIYSHSMNLCRFTPQAQSW